MNVVVRVIDVLLDWLRSLFQLLGKIMRGSLLGLATLLVAFLGLRVSYVQYETQKQRQDTQEKMYQYEVAVVEGQLAASLLSSLIRGDVAERKLALLVLKLKAPKLFEELMPVISVMDPSSEVREVARREYNDLLLSNRLANARLCMELKRYKSAAEFFYDAAAYVDTSKLDQSLLELATSRYRAHSDSLAAEVYRRVFKDY